MVLPDHEIKRLCVEHAMVVPFNQDLLNPASIDLLLGDHLMIEDPMNIEQRLISIKGYSQENPYWLRPGAVSYTHLRAHET